MAHPRKLIRDAAKAQLLNKTAAGTRISTTRVTPWRPQELPAISIYMLRDPVQPESMKSAPRELERRPAMVIECALKMKDAFVTANGGNIDDALDAFELQVLSAISADDTLGGTVGDIVIEDSEIEILRDGDQMIGVIACPFYCRYHMYMPEAVDVPLDDFDSADIRYSLANAVHVDDQANDLLENLYATP
jgi:hypothetical protein